MTRVETWIDFGRGPLFQLAFAIMVLGLSRVFLLTLVGLAESYPAKHGPHRAVAGGCQADAGLAVTREQILAAASRIRHGLFPVSRGPASGPVVLCLSRAPVEALGRLLLAGHLCRSGELAHTAGHRDWRRPACRARVSPRGQVAQQTPRLRVAPAAVDSNRERPSLRTSESATLRTRR
jgi:hypothetical protein